MKKHVLRGGAHEFRGWGIRATFLAVASLGGSTVASAADAANALTDEAAWAKRVSGYLETRDGVVLRYSVLLPEASGRFPVIINYSGYDPGAIGGSEYENGDTAMSRNLDRFLLENGYAVMGVNARGTGCSEGTFDFLGPEYGRDGYDTVEFAASQPWSDGNVGMANWSWAGMSQLMTAAEQPPHLRAIAPGMVVGDMRRDSWAPGGVPAPGFIIGWRGYLHNRWDAVRKSAVAEDDQRCLTQLEKNFAGEEENSITRLVFQHPLRDAVTDTRAPARNVERIKVPVFSMETFQDEAVTSRGDYFQERLDPETIWMLQTNGGHDLYASRTMWPTLVAFFDHFVKGKKNGFTETPHLSVWMETSSAGTDYESLQELAKPRWTFDYQDLEQAKPDPLEFRLSAGGRLALKGDADKHRQANEESDRMNYPVPGPAVATYENPMQWGPQEPDWKDGSLAFTSAQFTEPLLAWGSASADLWFSVTSAEADIQVTLTEVRPDRQEVFIQRGWLRLSNRSLEAEKSTALRPIPVDWPQAIQPLNPGDPVMARIEISKFAHAFPAGSRLRLWIDTPSAWGGYTFNHYAVPAEITLLRDKEHPSVLRIGILDDVAVPSESPQCGTVLGQPCRPDPFKN
jgi:putative CocE/NonD family hydrolase